MENNCKIENFCICKCENKRTAVLEGSFVCMPGSLHIFALLNGKEFDTYAYIIPTGHGKREVEHHFELEWPMPEELITSLNFVLKDYVNDPMEIIDCTEEDIKEHLVETSLIHHIIGTSFDENNVGMILGWSFSMLKKPVSFEVLDEDGTQVKMSLRRTIQQRLVDRRAVEKENALVGFIISFEGNKEHSYRLKMTDGTHSSEVVLAADSVNRSMNFDKFMSFCRAINKKNIMLGLNYLRENGLISFFKRLSTGVPEETDYNAWFRRIRVTKDELLAQRNHNFSYRPLISLIVPVFNTPADFLNEMIQSVISQSYENWELCIADGSDESSDARKIVKKYAAEDSRIKVTYLKENYGISGNTNKALDLAAGEYTGLFDHDDLLEADALYEIVDSLQKTKHDIIYTDEDKLNNETKEFEAPNFKPDYDEDLFLSHNYITHFFVVKTEILKSVGGFDSRYDGAQDYDVMLKCIEKSSSIHHVAKCLYHWRMHRMSTAMNPKSKMYCYVAGQNALQAHYDRVGIKAKVEMQGKPLYGEYHTIYDVPDTLVSIIIPNKDHTDILKTCVNSLIKINQYHNIEIIIVENNSTEQKTFDYYKELQDCQKQVKVVTWEGKDFNYSAINNFGVKYAAGEYLLFLNNDTEMIKADALSEMVSLCARKDVGVVGAKLLYADNTIQHAGVVIGFSGYAGHVFNEIPNGKYYGYMTRDVMNGDLCAVTAACMMTKKTVFESVGGFDESFKVACNDIDYCLKVVDSGKHVVYNAFSLWHHYESKSRGYENSYEKIARFDQEVEKWQQKWMPLLIQGDPYYNPNFKIEDGPFILK
jgi:Predicted glycosyltransferases